LPYSEVYGHTPTRRYDEIDKGSSETYPQLKTVFTEMAKSCVSNGLGTEQEAFVCMICRS